VIIIPTIFAPIFSKNNLLKLIVIYISILTFIFNSFFVPFSILFFVASYIFITIRYNNAIILYPFFIYPFMFLLRAHDPGNFILILLPDILTLVAVFFAFFFRKGKNLNKIFYQLTFIYIVLSFFILIIHVKEFLFIPVIFRQFSLPVLFMLAFVRVSFVEQKLPFDALKISIISFSIVCFLSILNAFDIIVINPSYTALYPYLNYEFDSDLIAGSRSVLEGSNFPRLNLFTGGALGSSAAIIFGLGLVAFFASKNYLNVLFKILSFPLFISSFLSFSVSVIIPIILLFIYFSFLKFNKFVFFFLIGLLITLLSSVVFLTGQSPFDYARSTSFSGLVSYINSMNLFMFLFGIGPRLTSEGFVFIPSLFFIDIGIFRVFSETGIFIFCLFISILYRPLKYGFIGLKNKNIYYSQFIWFFLLFLTFLLLVHGNMTALPPFFPLFSACVAVILNFKFNYDNYQAKIKI
jgi:hypothetical protein